MLSHYFHTISTNLSPAEKMAGNLVSNMTHKISKEDAARVKCLVMSLSDLLSDQPLMIDMKNVLMSDTHWWHSPAGQQGVPSYIDRGCLCRSIVCLMCMI